MSARIIVLPSIAGDPGLITKLEIITEREAVIKGNKVELVSRVQRFDDELEIMNDLLSMLLKRILGL